MDERIDELIKRADELVAAITYDDSGTAGRGGNGGLISRETIRKTDALRIALYGAKAGRNVLRLPPLPQSPTP